MVTVSLSKRDIDVLEKIKDPESNPSMGVMIDSSLPKDPNFPDQSIYDRVSRTESDIILAMQESELELAGLSPKTATDPANEYWRRLSQLNDLIAEHPRYASARNNRAQALRRLYGDTMLLADHGEASQALLHNKTAEERMQAASVALSDLERCLSLLSPPNPFSAISPTAAKTLSLAHTQRAAIYLATAKRLGAGTLRISSDRKEASWSSLEFEEAASRDFAMGGRYGNDIAKGLAVSTNPTAKLCGQIVREMMKKEYGPGLA
jgi:hypothetical protein